MMDPRITGEILNASTALARSCVQACKNTIEHAKIMLSVFGEPNMKNQLESEFLGSRSIGDGSSLQVQVSGS